MSQRVYAYNTIRNAITYGELKPGERLVEKRLCEMFKVGRTPLREALMQLEVEGYLEFIPNKGVSITSISIENVEDIYGILAVLEGYATEMATRYLTLGDIRKIESIQKNQRRAWAAKDFKKWLDKNALFHEYVVKAAKNSFLSAIIDNLRHRVYRYRLISITIPGAVDKYMEAHEEIIKAITKKETKRAGRAMQNHVLNASKELISFLKELPGL